MGYVPARCDVCGDLEPVRAESRARHLTTDTRGDVVRCGWFVPCAGEMTFAEAMRVLDALEDRRADERARYFETDWDLCEDNDGR